MGLDVKVHVEGAIVGLIFEGYVLPVGLYNTEKTRLLLQAPANPDGAMDMFWASPDLTRANGQAPTSAEVFEDHHGERWRRFSWHFKATWVPGRDNPVTYLSFVEDGLARAAA